MNIFITIVLILILWVIAVLIIVSIEGKNIDTFKELYGSMEMMDRIKKEIEKGGRR